MASSVPDELWRGRVVRRLPLPDVISLRNCWSIGTSIVTAALLVERIDGSLARHSLTCLVDIDRAAPLPFSYMLRAAYVLEQGSDEWPGMGRFIRLAAIYRLTPANGCPWCSTAFHRIPLAMAIYRLFRHLLTYGFNSLALQPADNGRYRIGYLPVRVVPLGELPSGHRYAEGYKRTDPVIRCGSLLFRSFSAFLLHTMICWCRQEKGWAR
ncbi:unnamed protein product [Vitrella brassicaformis CCMP3155]|uniref:Uncharacterized protein n=1 Tax=Vitrella brassicaformis (strain CCMP3155) TaxID=1169540 RepID=A0A0G4EYX2_VITBC|nr:unnamed protein product [Vitrella brassicaformis CCMP3155]|eukprot:CEM04367.1 unnamed protein product [Vitrella brassicaformis CCMP3155]